MSGNHSVQCVECGRALAGNSPAQICSACLLGETPVEPVMRVPGHEVLEELARGGMGVVYRAREHETRRTVALKMLRPRLADEEGMRERFRMEAAAAAALHHPAILPVYRVDESDAMPFFTMKLAEGGTLADRKADFHRRWRDIAALLATLADAVQYAHRHGVLHRDVKPGNVLFDEEGRAFLCDFGLVKLIDSVSELTGSQNFLGTPHYAAPEVAAANAGAATVASDVWSLGAVLYELLNGRPPFDAPGLVPLLRKIAEDTPAPFDAAVPADLRIIALKCLHKEPAQRYDSAAALADDLRAWQEGRPVKARAVSALERTLAWIRRNPAPAALAGALAISLTVLGGVLWRGYAASQRSAAEARAGEEKARISEASSLLDELRARIRGGQWVNRRQSIETVQRAHRLHASSASAEMLVSLLALPELVKTGEVPYDGGRPVFFSGDLSRYVARSSGKAVVCETATQQVIFTLPEGGTINFPPGPLSADGTRVYLRTSTGVNIWNAERGALLGTLKSGLWLPGFSRDGHITAGGRGIMDLSVQPPATRTVADTDCEAIAISPNGRMVLLAGRNKLQLLLADAATGSVLREYSLPGKSMMHCAVWSADSTHFCTGCTDGRIMRWNTETSQAEWIVPAHTDGVDDMALFDEDRHLITQSRDGLTKIWNLHSQTSVAVFPWGGLRVQASKDGRRLAVDCPPQKKSLLFDFTPPPACSHLRLPASHVPNSYLQGQGAVIPAADSQSFAVTAGHDLHLMDRDGNIRASIPCGQCEQLLPGPDGGGYMRIRRIEARYELMRVPLVWLGSWGDTALRLGKWNEEPAICRGVNPGSLYVGAAGTLTEVNPGTGATRTLIPAAQLNDSGPEVVASSPCGRYFAWAGGSEKSGRTPPAIHLMDAAAEKELAMIPRQSVPRMIAFDAAGDRLFTGDDSRLECYDTGTRRLLWGVPHSRQQSRSLHTPVCLVTGPHGIVAAPLTPDSISLLDSVSGEVRLTLKHPMGQSIRAIGLSPDGTRLLSVGSYTVQLWKLDAISTALDEQGFRDANID